MSLISNANALAYTDHLGAAYQILLNKIDDVANQAAPATGTVQNLMSSLLTLIDTTVADPDQINDLFGPVRAAFLIANAQYKSQFMLPVANALDSHCRLHGSTVDATIVSLATYLQSYNGGVGNANKFNCLVTPQYGLLYTALRNLNLPQVGVMSPAIHPVWNAAVSANGMGSETYAGVFAAGTAVNNTLYSEVQPVVEVVTDFAAGGAAPVVTIAGTDDAGAASTTWSVTLTGNNPTAALSTTITPAVLAQARQTVAVASATGIVIGSVVTINSGLPDQEVVVIENVSGSNITAVFQNAHAGSATVTGNKSYTTTPSVGGKRCRSVSNITLTLSSHNAGKVRVIGRQDRVAW